MSLRGYEKVCTIAIKQGLLDVFVSHVHTVIEIWLLMCGSHSLSSVFYFSLYFCENLIFINQSMRAQSCMGLCVQPHTLGDHVLIQPRGSEVLQPAIVGRGGHADEDLWAAADLFLAIKWCNGDACGCYHGEEPCRIQFVCGSFSKSPIVWLHHSCGYDLLRSSLAFTNDQKRPTSQRRDATSHTPMKVYVCHAVRWGVLPRYQGAGMACRHRIQILSERCRQYLPGFSGFFSFWMPIAAVNLNCQEGQQRKFYSWPLFIVMLR